MTLGALDGRGFRPHTSTSSCSKTSITAFVLQSKNQYTCRCRNKRSFDKTDLFVCVSLFFQVKFVLISCLINYSLNKSLEAIKTRQQGFLMGRCVGYARVSKEEQNLQLQVDALIKIGCQKNCIFTDKISGAKDNRPGLDSCLKNLAKGDTLVVWRLDRLGRSMSHLVNLIETLRQQGVSFKSICDGAIDTTTASGELIFNIFSSLSQFERRLTQERTKAGLFAARARGCVGGRKPLPSSAPKVITAKKMHADKTIKIEDICKTLRISRATLYRYLSMGKEETMERTAP